MAGASHRYLVALGSNVPHPRFGSPRGVILTAMSRLAEVGLPVERVSSIINTAPLGPSLRRYANAAAIVRTGLPPTDLLETLKAIETEFGRRSRGQRWGSRVLDLDVVLWSGGCWSDPNLTIPHPAFRSRAFVLVPAREVAADWRDPITGCTVRQLATRLTRPQPVA